MEIERIQKNFAEEKQIFKDKIKKEEEKNKELLRRNSEMERQLNSRIVKLALKLRYILCEIKKRLKQRN